MFLSIFFFSTNNNDNILPDYDFINRYICFYMAVHHEVQCLTTFFSPIFLWSQSMHVFIKKTHD